MEKHENKLVGPFSQADLNTYLKQAGDEGWQVVAVTACGAGFLAAITRPVPRVRITHTTSDGVTKDYVIEVR